MSLQFDRLTWRVATSRDQGFCGRWAVSLLVAVIMVTGGSVSLPPVAVADMSPVVQYFPLPDRYFQSPPALEEHDIAWSGTNADRNHTDTDRLYTSSLEPFKPQLVYSAKPGWAVIQVHLSASWLVWEDQAERGSWVIWAMNRSSGTNVQIASSQHAGKAPHPWLYPLLALSGSTVAWSQVRCVEPCIHGRDIETWSSSIRYQQLPAGTVHIVKTTKAPCNQYWPSLFGATLVWHQEGKCGGIVGSDVMFLNLGTKQMRALTSNHRGSEATTNGRFVAWKDSVSRFANGEIILLDLRTQRRIVASVRPVRGKGCAVRGGQPTGICDATPILSSGVLIWLAEGAGTVMARSLTTGKIYRLESASANSTPGLLGLGWSHVVTWESSRLQPGVAYPVRHLAVAEVP